MSQKLFSFFVFFSFIQLLQAQEFSSLLIDAETQEPVPSATIASSAYNGVISNEEGVFSIFIENTQLADSLSISCLGYKPKKILAKNPLPKEIILTPEVFEVMPVFLDLKELKPDEVMDLVKENLNKNYNFEYVAASVFTRNSGHGQMNKFDLNLKKSTVPKLNQTFLDKSFENQKGDFVYLNEAIEDVVVSKNWEGYIAPRRKLVIQSDKDPASAKKIQQDLIHLMEESFRPDSELIIKTGIIRLDKTEPVDSILSQMKDGLDDEIAEKGAKYPFNLNSLFLNKKSDVDFIYNPSKYIFEKEAFVLFNDNWVYKLRFRPKNKAKFKGYVYVNVADYAVLRVDFQNTEIPYKKFNLFGVHYKQPINKGMALFSKINAKYYLKYFKQNFKNVMGIERPFTIIEKNSHKKGRKRINKVFLDLNYQSTQFHTSEIVVSNVKLISKSDFDSFTPVSQVQKTRRFSYDPGFWKGYNILTPEKALQEIKIEE